MPSGTLYPLVNRALGGELEQRLRQLRGTEGLTFNEIAIAFREDGITVSDETIRNWCNDLRITKPENGEAA